MDTGGHDMKIGLINDNLLRQGLRQEGHLPEMPQGSWPRPQRPHHQCLSAMSITACSLQEGN